jgi:hypothetical protein
MPDYIQQKTDEKGKLEPKIIEVNDLKWKLIGDISSLETRHLVALDEQKITENNLKWYSDVKAELGKNGLPVNDVSQLIKVVSGISLKSQYDNLSREYTFLQQMVSSCNETLSL